MSDLASLQAIIDAAHERRAELTPRNTPHELGVALEQTIDLLDRGAVRVAEKREGRWIVHQWLKKAVLLYFRTRENAVIDAGYTRFYDKVPLKYAGAAEEQFRAGGARVVPHAIVRKGAYVAPNAVLFSVTFIVSVVARPSAPKFALALAIALLAVPVCAGRGPGLAASLNLISWEAALTTAAAS